MVYAVITIRGVVQGVGFRPFIKRLADKFNLKGIVYNRTGSVLIEVNGTKPQINNFKGSILKEKPPAAFISKITIEYPEKQKLFKDFLIIKSKSFYEPKVVPPDLKICDDCKKELFAPENRRYLYPFINCTNCGPRFSIILNTPYDRKNTTMKKFKMCDLCQKEYKDVLNRRFHAEPNACSKCGPEVFLKGKNKKILKGYNAILKAKELLKKGKIIAIKGIGGFHLACDATNNEAVLGLKIRKKRSNKPLAIMTDSIDKIKKFAYVSDFEKDLLTSTAAPIVLLKKKNSKILSDEIAKNIDKIGVFLPYTPLHYLLFDNDILALVMTSGNIAEEPIQHINEECFRNLFNIADYFLYHNRDINIPVDDSVIKPYSINKKTDNFVFIRRSRGYVPVRIDTGIKISKNILGAGALLKNTICLLDKSGAIMSQHIGDLENERVFKYYKQTIDDFLRFYEIKPEIIARDLHPDFLSSVYAEKLASVYKIKTLKIQHHYAHLLSCLAENNFYKKAIGVVFDGTGLGDDGNIWGGEFIIGDFKEYKRLAHFKYKKLPGGDKANRENYRMAISFLSEFLSKKEINKLYPDKDVDLILSMIERSINTPLTSSVGRIFDAVSSILNICHTATYEAEGPMLLESIANDFKGRLKIYDYDISQNNEIFEIDVKPMFINILCDLKKQNKKFIAASFHYTMAHIILDVAGLLYNKTKIKDIALSGGVFQNTLLLSQTINLLKKNKFNVLLHRKLSPNDSSIAFGQAVYAAFNS
jgi:hydrogenase maturation protein HypF